MDEWVDECVYDWVYESSIDGCINACMNVCKKVGSGWMMCACMGDCEAHCKPFEWPHIRKVPFKMSIYNLRGVIKPAIPDVGPT